MDESALRKVNLFGAWSGVVYSAFLLTGWWIVGGFFPLLSLSETAAQIATFFRTNTVQLRLGMVIMMWGAAFYIPFTSSVADFVTKLRAAMGR